MGVAHTASSVLGGEGDEEETAKTEAEHSERQGNYGRVWCQELNEETGDQLCSVLLMCQAGCG